MRPDSDHPLRPRQQACRPKAHRMRWGGGHLRGGPWGSPGSGWLCFALGGGQSTFHHLSASAPLPLSPFCPLGLGCVQQPLKPPPPLRPKTFQLRVWPLELGGLGLNSSSATSPLASDFISLWLSFPFCKMGEITSATLTVWSRESASYLNASTVPHRQRCGSVPLKRSLDKRNKHLLSTLCVLGPGLDRATQDKVLSLRERVGQREKAGS